MVIDGVGGQAAGGKAADTAVQMLRARLERETGPVALRLREAIAVANNEIHRLAGLRPEWDGMACVLTAVVLRDGSALVGHVGDTRLYKLRRGLIEKITRDHSPVGEREDAHELSELDAMQHPRRNEVYRDVGSEPHEPADPDFVDVQEISFEPDAALLLCSDGLTDLVDSASINQIVRRLAGRPQDVVTALIAAANDAGGKDNVTVVYVEGEQFPAAPRAAGVGGEPPPPEEITRRLGTSDARGTTRQRVVRMGNIALLAVVIVLTFVRSDSVAPPTLPVESAQAASDTSRIVVQASESIAQAIQRARAGTTIVVEPGEYRETLTLKSQVRLVSSVPRARDSAPTRRGVRTRGGNRRDGRDRRRARRLPDRGRCRDPARHRCADGRCGAVNLERGDHRRHQSRARHRQGLTGPHRRGRHRGQPGIGAGRSRRRDRCGVP